MSADKKSVELKNVTLLLAEKTFENKDNNEIIGYYDIELVLSNGAKVKAKLNKETAGFIKQGILF